MYFFLNIHLQIFFKFIKFILDNDCGLIFCRVVCHFNSLHTEWHWAPNSNGFIYLCNHRIVHCIQVELQSPGTFWDLRNWENWRQHSTINFTLLTSTYIESRILHRKEPNQEKTLSEWINPVERHVKANISGVMRPSITSYSFIRLVCFPSYFPKAMITLRHIRTILYFYNYIFKKTFCLPPHCPQLF